MLPSQSQKSSLLQPDIHQHNIIGNSHSGKCLITILANAQLKAFRPTIRALFSPYPSVFYKLFSAFELAVRTSSFSASNFPSYSLLSASLIDIYYLFYKISRQCVSAYNITHTYPSGTYHRFLHRYNGWAWFRMNTPSSILVSTIRFSFVWQNIHSSLPSSHDPLLKSLTVLMCK